MKKSTWRITVLLLRLVTFLLLVLSLVVLVTNTVKISDDEKITFKEFVAYRYVLAVEVIGCGYIVVQIAFAVLSVSRGDFGDNLRIWFHDQVADLVFAVFFATGVGAGFGLTVDLKRQFEGLSLTGLAPGLDKFFRLVYVSSTLLLLATVALAATILSLAYYVGNE